MSEYSILVWSPTNTVGNRPALTSARTFFSPQPILRAAPGMVKVSGSVMGRRAGRVMLGGLVFPIAGLFGNPVIDFRFQPANAIWAEVYPLRETALGLHAVDVIPRIIDAVGNDLFGEKAQFQILR